MVAGVTIETRAARDLGIVLLATEEAGTYSTCPLGLGGTLPIESRVRRTRGAVCGGQGGAWGVVAQAHLPRWEPDEGHNSAASLTWHQLEQSLFRTRLNGLERSRADGRTRVPAPIYTGWAANRRVPLPVSRPGLFISRRTDKWSQAVILTCGYFIKMYVGPFSAERQSEPAEGAHANYKAGFLLFS